jgi:hypothetical protein
MGKFINLEGQMNNVWKDDGWSSIDLYITSDSDQTAPCVTNHFGHFVDKCM